MEPVKVKICGITRLKDALKAVEAGADALGFVFWQKSPRRISPRDAGRIIRELPPFVAAVGVFVNEGPDRIRYVSRIAGLAAVQLHGDETPRICLEAAKASGVKVIKAVRVKDAGDVRGLKRYKSAAFLLDAFCEGMRGGTGRTFDWRLASEAGKAGRIILSGGLNPDNVREAVRLVRPYAVDVSSGVESSPGIKDHDKVARFIKEAKEACR